MASRSKGLHVALWVVQALLALAFGMSGAIKFVVPAGELPRALVLFIGTADVAAAPGAGRGEVVR